MTTPNSTPVVYDMVLSDFKTAIQTSNEAWATNIIQNIGEHNIAYLAAMTRRLIERHVEVVFTRPGMEIDTTPYTNRYTTRGQGLSIFDQHMLLTNYAPDVTYPLPVTIGGIQGLLERQDTDTPFVLKNTWDNLGRNKLLVATRDELTKVAEWADIMGLEDDKDYYLEPYIETPTEGPTSYRVTAVSTGDILSVSLKYAHHATKDAPVVSDPRLLLLADPRSSLYLDAPPITSNAATGGSSIALSTSRHSVVGQLSTAEHGILEQHGIVDRQAPAKLVKVAAMVARVIGPSQALLTGSDFLQDRTLDTFHFLESNSNPNLGNVRKTVGDNRTDLEIYVMAADMFARAC